MFRVRIKRKTNELGGKNPWQKAEQVQRSWGSHKLGMLGDGADSQGEACSFSGIKGKVKGSFPSTQSPPSLEITDSPPEKEYSDEIFSLPTLPHTWLSDITLCVSLPMYFPSLRHNHMGLGGKEKRRHPSFPFCMEGSYSSTALSLKKQLPWIRPRLFQDQKLTKTPSHSKSASKQAIGQPSVEEK